MLASQSSSQKKGAVAQPTISSSRSGTDANSVAIQKEFDVTHQVLQKLRDNPNKHLSQLSQQVADLNS